MPSPDQSNFSWARNKFTSRSSEGWHIWGYGPWRINWHLKLTKSAYKVIDPKGDNLASFDDLDDAKAYVEQENAKAK